MSPQKLCLTHYSTNIYLKPIPTLRVPHSYPLALGVKYLLSHSSFISLKSDISISEDP